MGAAVPIIAGISMVTGAGMSLYGAKQQRDDMRKAYGAPMPSVPGVAPAGAPGSPQYAAQVAQARAALGAQAAGLSDEELMRRLGAGLVNGAAGTRRAEADANFARQQYQIAPMPTPQDFSGIIEKVGAPQDYSKIIEGVGAFTPGGNTRKLTPFDPSSFYANLRAYDPTGLYRDVKPLDPTKYYEGLTPFDPTPFISGMIPPSLERLLKEGTIDQSEFDNIQVDPRLKDTQMRALRKMEEVANQGGLTVQDRIKVRELLDTVARQTRMQMQGMRQKYEAQGMGGSGVELASALAAQQGAIEGESQMMADVMAMAQQREFDAIQAAGAMAGQMHAQDYNEQARRAEAVDAINRFNSAQRSDAMKWQWNAQFQYAEAMAAAGQMKYQNQFQLADTIAGAAQTGYQNLMHLLGQQMQAGQMAYQNQFQLQDARAQAGQTAYQNRFQLATTIDNYDQLGYQNRFNLARAIADARHTYYSDNLGYATTLAGAKRNYYADQVQNAQSARDAQQQTFNNQMRQYEAQLAARMNKASQPNGWQAAGSLIGGLGGALGKLF